MNPLGRVAEWWRRRHRKPFELREPDVQPRDKRGPVEHGPTKAPFSRRRRRVRNRAASRSLAVTRRRMPGSVRT